MQQKHSLDAGRLAGSAKTKQPWSFILMRERIELEELARYGNSTKPLREAAFAVVIAIPYDYMQDRFDAGRAAQNMMLAAHVLGIGSCPVSLHDADGARKHLNLPAGLQVQVAVAFGYPASTKRKGKVMRKPLEEILHIGKWRSEKGKPVPIR